MSRGNDQRGNYAHLEQSLVAPEGDLPTTTAVPMVEVVAPATLSEGYSFQVEMEGGKTISVQVPPGGVEEGQKFMVPLSEQDSSSVKFGMPRIQVPVGEWRDGLCNCFKYGLCHYHLWTSCCCVLIASGQVISRLQLTWMGRPGHSIAETTGAFWILFYIVAAYWTLYLVLGMMVDPLNNSAYTTTILVFRSILWWCFWILSIFVLKNVRQEVRSKYAIPEHEHCPTGCEDVCCSLWCPHLTAAQLLRHTTDYDTYHSSCCTETGVPSTVPSIV